jgi:hypothetical protein
VRLIEVQYNLLTFYVFLSSFLSTAHRGTVQSAYLNTCMYGVVPCTVHWTVPLYTSLYL